MAIQGYLRGGGRLFISGADIGYDLVERKRAFDNLEVDSQRFYEGFLKARYIRDNAGSYSVTGVPGTLFEGLSFNFDDGTQGTYDANYPDAIMPNAGGIACLTYGSGNYAAVEFTGPFPGADSVANTESQITNQTRVIFNDDFESYADNNALTAAYDTNTITGLYTSTGIFTRDNQSVFNPDSDASTARLSNSFPAINSHNETIVVTYWLYDSSGTGPGSTGSPTLNGRGGLSLGAYSGGAWASGTLENYIYIGAQHSTSPEYYCARVVNGGSGWQATSAIRSVGWQKFTMILQSGVVRFYHNDNLVLTDTYTEPASGWNCFKLGATTGPTRMDVYYDDLEIRVQPPSVSPYQEGKVIYFGFPFETIYPESVRNIVMERVMGYFFPSTIPGWEIY